MSINDLIIKEKEKRLSDISEELIEINKSAISSIDQATKNKLIKKFDLLTEEAKQLETQIEELKNASNLLKTKSHCIDRLYKINFNNTVEKINHFIAPETEDLSMVLLIQNSLKMGGKLCLARIIELLKDKTIDFRHYPIEFTVTNSLDENGILLSLGRYFGIDKDVEYLYLSDKLIEKITSSLQSGSILLIEIKGIDLTHRAHEIIYSLVMEFWENLLSKTDQLSHKYRKIKLLLVFITEKNTILQKIFEIEQECNSQTINDKIFEVVLTNWQLNEISHWLDYHSGLEISQNDNFADYIFQSTEEGIPILVHQLLCEHFKVENIL